MYEKDEALRALENCERATRTDAHNWPGWLNSRELVATRRQIDEILGKLGIPDDIEWDTPFVEAAQRLGTYLGTVHVAQTYRSHASRHQHKVVGNYIPEPPAESPQELLTYLTGFKPKLPSALPPPLANLINESAKATVIELSQPLQSIDIRKSAALADLLDSQAKTFSVPDESIAHRALQTMADYDKALELITKRQLVVEALHTRSRLLGVNEDEYLEAARGTQQQLTRTLIADADAEVAGVTTAPGLSRTFETRITRLAEATDAIRKSATRGPDSRHASSGHTSSNLLVKISELAETIGKESATLIDTHELDQVLHVLEAPKRLLARSHRPSAAQVEGIVERLVNAINAPKQSLLLSTDIHSVADAAIIIEKYNTAYTKQQQGLLGLAAEATEIVRTSNGRHLSETEASDLKKALDALRENLTSWRTHKSNGKSHGIYDDVREINHYVASFHQQIDIEAAQHERLARSKAYSPTTMPVYGDANQIELATRTENGLHFSAATTHSTRSIETVRPAVTFNRGLEIA